MVVCGYRRIVASSQGGSVNRHGSPLRTTTSKLQLKYRTTERTVLEQQQKKVLKIYRTTITQKHHKSS